MELIKDDRLEALRTELRRFIAANRPALVTVPKAGVRAPEPEDIPALRKWTGQLFGAGYFGDEWPVEWGGHGSHDPLRTTVIGEELARARVPGPLGAGLLAAMALIHFGSEQQMARYLPRIRTGEDIWCQLFSEPGAGSDLASLQTRARRDGDAFVIDGQKVWTTNGHHAELGYLLARTNPDVAKQAGITAFVVDMKTPGIEVRPLREITGTCDFNEVFFDSVRVPAENVIGSVDAGWTVATTSLVHERSSAGTGGIATLRALGEALKLAKDLQRGGAPALDSDEIRQTFGRLYASTRVGILLSHYNLSRSLAGTADAGDAPIQKILFSETNLALAEFGLDLQGTDSLLAEGDPGALANGWWQDAFLYARAYTIAGGANEVLRNMVAERALGLPRDSKA